MQGRACGAGESLAYFAARDSMDIEGLGDKVIAALVAAAHASQEEVRKSRAPQLFKIARTAPLPGLPYRIEVVLQWYLQVGITRRWRTSRRT